MATQTSNHPPIRGNGTGPAAAHAVSERHIFGRGNGTLEEMSGSSSTAAQAASRARRDAQQPTAGANRHANAMATGESSDQSRHDQQQRDDHRGRRTNGRVHRAAASDSDSSDIDDTANGSERDQQLYSNTSTSNTNGNGTSTLRNRRGGTTLHEQNGGARGSNGGVDSVKMNGHSNGHTNGHSNGHQSNAKKPHSHALFNSRLYDAMCPCLARSNCNKHQNGHLATSSSSPGIDIASIGGSGGMTVTPNTSKRVLWLFGPLACIILAVVLVFGPDNASIPMPGSNIEQFRFNVHSAWKTGVSAVWDYDQKLTAGVGRWLRSCSSNVASMSSLGVGPEISPSRWYNRLKASAQHSLGYALLSASRSILPADEVVTADIAAGSLTSVLQEAVQLRLFDQLSTPCPADMKLVIKGQKKEKKHAGKHGASAADDADHKTTRTRARTRAKSKLNAQSPDAAGQSSHPGSSTGGQGYGSAAHGCPIGYTVLDLIHAISTSSVDTSSASSTSTHSRSATAAAAAAAPTYVDHIRLTRILKILQAHGYVRTVIVPPNVVIVTSSGSSSGGRGSGVHSNRQRKADGKERRWTVTSLGATLAARRSAPEVADSMVDASSGLMARPLLDFFAKAQQYHHNAGNGTQPICYRRARVLLFEAGQNAAMHSFDWYGNRTVSFADMSSWYKKMMMAAGKGVLTAVTNGMQAAARGIRRLVGGQPPAASSLPDVREQDSSLGAVPTASPSGHITSTSAHRIIAMGSASHAVLPLVVMGNRQLNGVMIASAIDPRSGTAKRAERILDRLRHSAGTDSITGDTAAATSSSSPDELGHINSTLSRITVVQAEITGRSEDGDTTLPLARRGDTFLL